MNRWTGKIAVITGASSGIGAAIVKDLLKANIIVVGLALDLNNLIEFKLTFSSELQPFFHPFKCDIRCEEDVKRIFKSIETNHGPIHILINSAGTISHEKLLETKTEVIQRMLNTNVLGTVNCVRSAFQSMRKNNIDGHMILMNSILGHRISNTGHSFSIYPATKYAVTALAEIFRQEFSSFGTKIKITSISPGVVNTPMLKSFEKKHNETGTPFLNPEDVSNTVLYALSTPPNVEISELLVQTTGETL